MRIGFIGLGIMGRPMAENLHKGGHALIVPERGSLAPEIRAIAQVRDDPQSLAAAANGMADADHSALVTSLGLLAGVKLAG